jgi:hypothetical protein
VDGGRLQIFERSAPAEKAASVPEEIIEDDELVVETEGSASAKKSYWREDKIGVLLTLTRVTHTLDPCPEVPESFVNPTWIPELAKELNRRGPRKGEGEKTATGPPGVPKHEPGQTLAKWEPPEVETKQVLATRRRWEEFGPLLAAKAWSLGYFGAPARAFLGDGAETNWTLWRTLFSSFVPILDFIHALTYVFHAALAGRPFAEGWRVYERWIGWVWSGQVEQVLVELAQRQAELGPAPPAAKENSPCHVVAKALGYLQRNKERMRYATYRQQGLPIVSSYVESAVKQFNYRVKGTEKLWRESGAEQMLQLRADYLSDDNAMADFWQRRQASESGQPRHRTAA